MHIIGILLKVIAVIAALINPVYSQITLPSDYPVYKDGKLTIPRIDIETESGKYQEVEFQFENSTNSWKLLNFVTSEISRRDHVIKVETVIVDSFPVQVFLRVNAYVPSPCGFSTPINQIRKGNKFEITMHLIPKTFPPGRNITDIVLCSQFVVFYEQNIPLWTYGLPAGTYEYSVNDTHTGTFTLSKENRFAPSSPNIGQRD